MHKHIKLSTISESQYSVASVESAIKGALGVLQTSKSADKNLQLKNYIKEIKYSKEKIEIEFYYHQAQNGPKIGSFGVNAKQLAFQKDKQNSTTANLVLAKKTARNSKTPNGENSPFVASVRNLLNGGQQESSTNSFTLSFTNTINKLAKLK